MPKKAHCFKCIYLFWCLIAPLPFRRTEKAVGTRHGAHYTSSEQLVSNLPSRFCTAAGTLQLTLCIFEDTPCLCSAPPPQQFIDAKASSWASGFNYGNEEVCYRRKWAVFIFPWLGQVSVRWHLGTDPPSGWGCVFFHRKPHPRWELWSWNRLRCRVKEGGDWLRFCRA